MRTITIHEETLRDGEQTPSVNFLKDEKVVIARALARMLPDCIINAGYPSVSRAEFESVQAVANAVEGASVFCTGRATSDDLSLCYDAVRKAWDPRISFWVPASRLLAKSRLGKTQTEVVALARGMLRHGLHLSKGRVPVDVALADASRTQIEFLLDICQMLQGEGVGIIFVCDTTGYMAVNEFSGLIATIKQEVPKACLGAHVHNDFGLATASALAALEAGAEVVSTTVNGISERAGMPATEEMIANLLLRQDRYKLGLKADPAQILTVSRMVTEASGIAPSSCKPVVGSAVLVRETGTQVDCLLKDPKTFEGIPLTWLGRSPEFPIVVGKMSSHGSIRQKLAQLGHTVTEDELNTVFNLVKELSGYQKAISDDDLLRLLSRARTGK